MVNSVRVVLLKARGWRGTSLPRVYDNMWFSNPVRFCFFQLRSGCEKAEPVPGSFHAFIYSPRSSFHSPTWGYQKHNSYRVAMLYSAFVMQYSANYADNLSPVYPPCRFISFTNVGFSEAQLVPSCGAIQRILGYCIVFSYASF